MTLIQVATGVQWKIDEQYEDLRRAMRRMYDGR
jgi:hypothetical protein